MMSQQTQETVKIVGDIAAATTMVGTLVSYLPAVAAVFTVVWTGLRIYEIFFGPIYKGKKE